MAENRIALALGGGGARGSYQIGVWQALRELGMDIGFVAGTSVGSINGLMVVSDQYEQALDIWENTRIAEIFDIARGREASELSETEEFFGFLREVLLHGGAESSGLLDLLRAYGNEDLIRASDIGYGLVVTEFPSLKGHTLLLEDIPQGKLFDFVVASSSCFPAAHYHEIDGVRYIDGAYTDNVPVELALKSGASKVIAVDLMSPGIVKKNPTRGVGKREVEVVWIRSAWSLGSILIFDQQQSRRNIRLGYLDAMKALGILEGKRYTFEKGAFQERDLRRADAAANAFGLDPLVVYSRDSLIRDLRGQVVDAQVALKRKPLPVTLLAEPARVTLLAQKLRESRRENRILGGELIRPYIRDLEAADFILKAGLLQD
jgi:NTE family protein